MERWASVPGFEGWYEASDLGRVRSVDRVITHSDGRVRHYPSRVLKPLLNDGRAFVMLATGGRVRPRMVHRLVLESFVGLRPDGLECRHLDGDPRNNRLDNLVWGTHGENEQDKRRHGTYKQRFRKLDEPSVREIRRLAQVGGMSQASIGRKFGVTQSAVWRILSGLSWSDTR